MPLLKIQTNVPVAAGAGETLVIEASRSVAEMLGKPESYVMVTLEPTATMAFAGTTLPQAYLELKSIGLPQGRTAALSKTLCEIMTETLGIPADRVYIEFADAQGSMWGWSGRTF